MEDGLFLQIPPLPPEGPLPLLEGSALGLRIAAGAGACYADAFGMTGTVPVIHTVVDAAADAERPVGDVVAHYIGGRLFLFLERTAAGIAAAAGVGPFYRNIGTAAAVVGIIGTGGNTAF